MNNRKKTKQGFQAQSGCPRRRLGAFLLEKLDSGRIKGLEWLDRNEKLFKVSWMDQRNNVSNDERNQIFKEWEIHNNRYEEGAPVDWSKWKQTFRGALNKSPDVHAVPEMHDTKNTLMPYKVYRFDDAINLESLDSSFHFESAYLNNEKEYSQMECNIPYTVIAELKIMHNSAIDPGKEMLSQDQISNCFKLNRPEENFSPIDFVQSSLLNPEHSGIFQNLHPTPSCNEENLHVHRTYLDHNYQMDSDEFNSYFPKNLTDSSMDCISIPSFNTPDFCQDDKPMVRIEAFYFNIPVLKTTIYKNQGVRVYFGLEPNLDNPELYGPKEYKQIELPDITKIENNLMKKDENSIKLIEKILNNMCRGLLVYCKDNKIFAYRHCIPRIYLWDEISGSNITLDRKSKMEHELFDMKKFETRLQDYKMDSGCEKQFPPSPSVVLALGKEYKPVNSINKTLMVHLELTYLEAEERLRDEIPNDQEHQFSDLNSADLLAEQYKLMNLNGTARI